MSEVMRVEEDLCEWQWEEVLGRRRLEGGELVLASLKPVPSTNKPTKVPV